MSEQLKVGISDYKVTKAPNTLITLGLGSCVGIAIYDRETKIGGLSHIMLPDSKSFSNNIKVEKFADLAIPAMVDEILNKSKNKNLVAKIAGGASMFNFSDSNLNIGKRNVEAVENILKELKIPILAKDTGGNTGRTMIVSLDSFDVDIRMVNGNIKTL